MTRFEEELMQSVDFMKWRKTHEADASPVKSFLRTKEGKTFLGDYEATHGAPPPTDWVQDAIIHPSGKIIRPSPDDTIIATKSPVSGFDSESMKIDLDQLSKAMESSGKGNEIVESLAILIETIKDKPFNNVIQYNNSSSVDFDKLRTV